MPVFGLTIRLPERHLAARAGTLAEAFALDADELADDTYPWVGSCAIFHFPSRQQSGGSRQWLDAVFRRWRRQGELPYRIFAIGFAMTRREWDRVENAGAICVRSVRFRQMDGRRGWGRVR